MDEGGRSMTAHFTKQEEALQSFYERMALETDHLKSVLAVKMHVQINKSGVGFEDALERLVSGELLARQAFEELNKTREQDLNKSLEELVVALEVMQDDYNVQGVKELVRILLDHFSNARLMLKMERKRRKTFSSHVEIVGTPIVDALIALDMNEANVQVCNDLCWLQIFFLKDCFAVSG